MLHTSAAIYDLRIHNVFPDIGADSKTLLIMRVLSSAGQDFATDLQDAVNRYEAENDHLDWTNAVVAVLYFGLTPRPARETITLPSGMCVKVFNLNLSSFANEVKGLKSYAVFLERTRALLMKGETPDDVLEQLLSDPKMSALLTYLLKDPRRAISDIVRVWLALKDDGAL